jgi:hypothetical protein
MEWKAFFINEINPLCYCTVSLLEVYSRREGVAIACSCLNTEGPVRLAEHSTITIPSRNIRKVM